MSYQTDVAVVIGRFQLPHKPHLHLISTALDKAKFVVVLLGSAFHARTIKNAFTCEEREAMIRLCLTDEQNDRIVFMPIRDYHDDAKWNCVAAIKVRKAMEERGISQLSEINCVGFFKDASTQYLSKMPWPVIDAGSPMAIDATTLRMMLFESEDIDVTLAAMRAYVPVPVLKYLKTWSFLPHLEYLKAEHFKIKAERKTYGAEYGLTGDFILQYNDYVLLVRRGRMPGRGLFAIPGGFYEPNANETLMQCALREAQEETQHTIWDHQLMQSFQDRQFFDAPNRSVRKNIMTMAHYFKMSGGDELPQIKGAKDPGESYPTWVKISDLSSMEDQFFDDHFTILQYFLKFPIVD